MARKPKAALDWRERAISATRGNQSQFGAILLAAMNRSGTSTPRYVGRAAITSDGFVMCGFIDRSGCHHHGAFVGAASDLVANTEGLARHLNLTAQERAALRDTVRQWVAVDYSHGRALRFTEESR